MKDEAEVLLEIMVRNQRTKPTKGWKPYMIVDAVHRYACPATRLGDKSGPCVCGAAAMMKEFKSAWAKFRKAVGQKEAESAFLAQYEILFS